MVSPVGVPAERKICDIMQLSQLTLHGGPANTSYGLSDHTLQMVGSLQQAESRLQLR